LTSVGLRRKGHEAVACELRVMVPRSLLRVTGGGGL
jgi:hypothetical protein